MGKKGNNIWSQLKGVKKNISGEVTISMEDVINDELVEVKIPIKFLEFDTIGDINDEYEEKKSEKPVITVDVNNRRKSFPVPSDKEKYKAFNNHPKAKEWEKANKGVEKERQYRLAFEFIKEDCRPAENFEEAYTIMNEDLRRTDIADILEEGLRVSGLSTKLEDAEKN